jgi:hypothetical protein
VREKQTTWSGALAQAHLRAMRKGDLARSRADRAAGGGARGDGLT